MEDDPVITEYDVFVSTNLSPYLHLVQYPSSLLDLETECDRSLPLTGRYKKQHHVLELEYPLNIHTSFYSQERGKELATTSQTGRIPPSSDTSATRETGILDKIKMVGTKVKLNEDSLYFIVSQQSDGLILTPVETLLNLKPNFRYLDDADSKTKAMTKRLDVESSTEEGKSTVNTNTNTVPKAVQVQFKKRETEEQIAARLTSFTYLQRQLEDEPWVPLTHFVKGSTESETVATKLTLVSLADPIHNSTNC